MSEQEALERFKELHINNEGDTEYLHWAADDLLCDLLEDKYPELIKQYKALPKWYA